MKEKVINVLQKIGKMSWNKTLPQESNQIYFKQFSLAWVHSLIVKIISIFSYSILSESSNSAKSV